MWKKLSSFWKNSPKIIRPKHSQFVGYSVKINRTLTNEELTYLFSIHFTTEVLLTSASVRNAPESMQELFTGVYV